MQLLLSCSEEYNPPYDLTGEWHLTYKIETYVMYEGGRIIVHPDAGNSEAVLANITQIDRKLLITTKGFSLEGTLNPREHFDIKRKPYPYKILVYGDVSEDYIVGDWHIWIYHRTDNEWSDYWILQAEASGSFEASRN
jgi:hypothetical protein